MRAALIEEIFSGAGLPTAGVDRTTLNIPNPLPPQGIYANNLKRVDYRELDVFDNTPRRIGTTEFWIFRPLKTNNRLVVKILGHNPEGITHNAGELVKELVETGYTVALGHSFPNLSDSGIVGLNDVPTHNALPGPTPTLNPLRYFLQGPVRIVNDLKGEGFEYIFGVGQSGGAWEIVLWAAIDTRVKATCGHAGYWALYMENKTRDWEQLLPLHSRGLSELEKVDYPDLAALACHPNRVHIQSCNDTESIFPRWQYDIKTPYARIVSKVARNFGGHYELQFDQNPEHTYLPSRTAAIVKLFNSF
jgi:hypothetical protein